MRCGANDVVIYGAGSTPFIARMPNAERCEIRVGQLKIQCRMIDGVVFIEGGDRIPVLSRRYLKLSKSVRYCISGPDLNEEIAMNMSQQELLRLFEKYEVPSKLLSALSEDFLRETILVLENNVLRGFRSNDVVKTKGCCQLRAFEATTHFTADEIAELWAIWISRVEESITERFGYLAADLVDLCSEKTISFRIYLYSAPPVVTDIDGTLTHADICAFCPHKTPTANLLVNPVMVTSRTFLWRQATLRMGDEWFGGAPALLFPGGTPIRHCDRVAGKILALHGLAGVVHGYGNTESDRVAFLASGIPNVVIV